MTEQEWLVSSDPAAMLAWIVPDGEISGRAYVGVTDRKLRLLACAVYRAIKPHTERQEAHAVNWENDIGNPLGHLPSWIKVAKYQSEFAALLRDIFGNPFRTVKLPHSSHCPSWAGPKDAV